MKSQKKFKATKVVTIAIGFPLAILCTIYLRKQDYLTIILFELFFLTCLAFLYYRLNSLLNKESFLFRNSPFLDKREAKIEIYNDLDINLLEETLNSLSPIKRDQETLITQTQSIDLGEKFGGRRICPGLLISINKQKGKTIIKIQVHKKELLNYTGFFAIHKAIYLIGDKLKDNNIDSIGVFSKKT